MADLSTPEGRRGAVDGAGTVRRRAGRHRDLRRTGRHAGRAGSLLASVNYFGTVEVLEGLRPLLAPAGPAVAISSNSTTVQPAVPADLVEACLDHDEERSAPDRRRPGLHRGLPGHEDGGGPLGPPQCHGARVGRVGLRLNAIAPGMIDTPMVAGMRADPEAGPLLDMLPIPVGRPGRPEEIAALVEFLLGPDGAFFCGSVLFCDGGSDALLRTSDWPAAWDISVRDLGRQLS